MDSTHAVAEMQKRIELLHPEKQEKWTIGCACLISKKSNQNESKELFILTFDEKPKKCYLMLRTVIVEADKDLAAIIDKMKLFQLRQSITIVGWQYKIGDFMVKIGSVLLGSNTKGLIMEIEYIPCVLPNKCSELLEEFITNLGPFEQKISAPINYSEIFALPELYSLQHTTFQYVSLFKSMGLLAIK